MRIVHPDTYFHPFVDLPDDLDPEVNPIIAAHWFGIDTDTEPANALHADKEFLAKLRSAESLMPQLDATEIKGLLEKQ